MASRSKTTSTKSNGRSSTNARGLVVKDFEIGTLSNKQFQSYTNFSMEIAHAVSSPKGCKPTLFGYVYCIKSSSGQHR